MRRVTAAVIDDQDFTRSGDHVDIDRTEDQTFGRGHKNIAGPGDLVDLRYRLRTVGKGRHSLGTAQLENPVDASNMGGSEHVGINHTIRHRYDHNDFTNACHLGRHRIHQHRRRVGSLAARYINSDTVKRGNHLPQADIRLVIREPGLFFLFGVESCNPIGSQLQGCQGLAIDGSKSLCYLISRDLESCSVQLETIKALCIFTKRCVATFTDIVEDLLNRFKNSGRCGLATLTDLAKVLSKAGI